MSTSILFCLVTPIWSIRHHRITLHPSGIPVLVSAPELLTRLPVCSPLSASIGLISILRWKSQRIKIYRLGYRFFIDF
jgi:hypothetical protein